MRAAFTAAAILAIAACAAPAYAQPSVAGWTVRGKSQIQIAPHEWALVGDAEIERGDTTLYADEIDMFDEENRAVASGNVLLSQGANRIGADRAEFDTKAGLGTFHHAYGIATSQPQRPRPASSTNPGAFVAPQMTGQDTDVYFFGDIIEKIGPKKYKISNGGFTTCLQPTPRWNLTGTTIVVNMNHYTLLQNMVLNVKGVPLFYLPFMYYPTKQDQRATGFLIPTYGASSVLGQSIHNAFFWAIDRSQDLTVQHEWFSKMGQGLGGEYRYNWGGGDAGTISAFALTPKSGQLEGLPTNRSYDIQGSATETLPGHFLARANVNYFSDLATHQIFNNGLSAFSNQTEYAGNLTGTWRNYAVNATFTRDQYFYDATDSTITGGTPRIDISRNERPLFPGSQIYFAATGEYAHLSNEQTSVDQTSGLVTDLNHNVNRLDFSPTIRYPFKKWQWLTVNSSVAFHDTYYTNSYAQPLIPGVTDPTQDPVLGQGLNRKYATVQAQITGPVFSRIFDTPGNGYAEKFKHTIEPTFTISRTSAIDDDVRLRIVSNDATDYAVGGTTNLSYGINNHFLAKRKVGQTSSSTEVLLLSISQTYYTNKTASQYDVGYQATPTTVAPSNFSPVRAELRATPTNTTTADVTTQFDARSHKMDFMSMTGSYAWSTLLRTTGSWTRTFTEVPDATGVIERSLVSNALSATTNFQTRDNRFGGVYQLMYDFHNAPHLQSQTVSGFYNAQCCGLAVSYMNRPLYGISGLTSNHTFFISVTLAGLGSVSPFSGGAGMPGSTPYR
jgi:lipopolysaccharide assembly outer membrane protein LptD (OstA)